MSLAIKHRPQTFRQVHGNSSTIRGLQSIFEDKQDIPHTFLFTGPTGCGKTTLGRIVASELKAIDLDFKEINTADFRGIDTAREIRKQVRLRPQHPDSKCTVWLIDECHSLTKDAQNALLKTLEEAPAHVYFILCTTDPEKLLKTVVGRCTTFSVAPLTEDEMMLFLKRICRTEKIKASNDIRRLIYEQSLGHPRNALKLLEKVIGLSQDEMKDIIKEEAARQNEAIELARALINKSSWKKVGAILKGIQAENEESIRRMVLAYCNTILLKQNNFQAFLIMDEFAEPFYNTGKPGLTLACYKAIHGEE